MIKVEKRTETPRLTFDLWNQNDRIMNENDIALLKQYAIEKYPNCIMYADSQYSGDKFFIISTARREYNFFKAGKNAFTTLIYAANRWGTIGNTPIRREIWFFN